MSAKKYFDAAGRWDMAALQHLLDMDPVLALQADRLRRTALHRLAAVRPADLGRPAEDAVPSARLLLARGVPLDAVRPIADDRDVFPATALWAAVAHGGNRPLARFLLTQGASPDWCLWAAVFADDRGILADLLAARPKLDLRWAEETPFFYAVRLRRFGAARMLADAGADTGAPGPKGETAAALAARRRYPASIRAWLSGTG